MWNKLAQHLFQTSVYQSNLNLPKTFSSCVILTKKVIFFSSIYFSRSPLSMKYKLRRNNILTSTALFVCFFSCLNTRYHSGMLRWTVFFWNVSCEALFPHRIQKTPIFTIVHPGNSIAQGRQARLFGCLALWCFK